MLALYEEHQLKPVIDKIYRLEEIGKRLISIWKKEVFLGKLSSLFRNKNKGAS